MAEHPHFPRSFVAKNNSITSCPVCNGLSLNTESHCAACDEPIHTRIPASLQRTIALLITACILYIPANVFTILSTQSVIGTDGIDQGTIEKTILGGIILFLDHGDYIIARVIFTASIIVPIAKIGAVSWLCVCAITPRWSQPLGNTRLYRLTELFGRWSMIDVFVVGLLSTLVQLEGLVSVTPGIAVIAFAGVVIATMLATMSFDTRLIWDLWEKNNNERR